ncbi:unnamed protein product [Amoebophrya sp. A25]|nr:unnamed protein product [Amoebophrya sp. A25]|eukprot:GSA25T00024882001.1
MTRTRWRFLIELLLVVPALGLLIQQEPLLDAVALATTRRAACSFCASQCGSIDVCYAGPCGLDAEAKVERFRVSNQCLTCDKDAADSQGIKRCNEESGRAAPKQRALLSVRHGSSTESSSETSTSTKGDLRTRADKVLAAAASASSEAAALEAEAAKELEKNESAAAAAATTGSAQQADALMVEAGADERKAEKTKGALDLAKKATETVAKRYLTAYAALREKELAVESAAREMEAAERDQNALQEAYETASAKAAEASQQAATLSAASKKTGLARARAAKILQAAKAARESSETATVQAQHLMARLEDASSSTGGALLVTSNVGAASTSSTGSASASSNDDTSDDMVDALGRLQS